MNKLITNSGIKFLLLTIIFTGIFLSCKQQDEKKSPAETVQNATIAEEFNAVSFPDQGNLVEVTTNNMDFEAPDELLSGWTTFRYHNKSDMNHFFIIQKLPVINGKQMTLADAKRDLTPVFNDAMELIREGKPEEGFAQFENFPEWAYKVVYAGGVGFLSAGETGQTDIFLEPGEYVLECYVKTNGVFHGDLGMYKEFTVTDEQSTTSPPSPTLEMNVSEEGGFKMDTEVKPGMQVLAVNFIDQVPHENALGHDVHLVKLNENSNLDEIETWVNWAHPTGLETPAPAGKFLGGVQDMPAGNTGYMTANFTPGRYAWIAEVPESSSKGMLKTFTVKEGEKTGTEEEIEQTN